MPAALMDTHCHVGAYDDPQQILQQARDATIGVVAVTEDPGEYRLLRTRIGRRKGVKVALGMHPLRASTFSQHDLARFFRLLPQAEWIGEVGLDYSRAGAATKREQARVFDVVLTEAQPGRHPLTVHSRGAEREVVKRLCDARLPAVLHWYSGPSGLIDDAASAGIYFSVNTAMVRSRKFHSLLSAIPASRLLLETDGPYARIGNRVARPDDLPGVVDRLAQLLGQESAAMATAICENQSRLIARSAAT